MRRLSIVIKISKVYTILGCIADARIEVGEDEVVEWGKQNVGADDTQHYSVASMQ